MNNSINQSAIGEYKNGNYEKGRYLSQDALLSDIKKGKTFVLKGNLIGWSYLSQQEFSVAVEELLKVRYLYQRHDFWVNSATLDAAVCQENLNKKDEAIRLYNLVIENNTDNQFAIEAVNALEKLK